MKRCTGAAARGFTLVELLVSLAICLVVVLALITMLVNVNRNNSELGISTRMVENGRFAVQVLASDLSHAGFWGAHVPDYEDVTFSGTPAPASLAGGQVPDAVPDPCLPYTPGNWTSTHKANLIGIAVQGGNISVAAGAPFCAHLMTAAKRGNDVLVVRHAEPCIAGSGSNECADTLGTPSADIYFQASRCSKDAAPYVMGNVPAAFVLRQRDCTAPAERRRLASTLYYVKNEGGTATLMRSQLLAGGAVPAHQPAQALVENVEAFRIEFGIDDRSDTNEPVDPAAPVAWAQAEARTSPRNRGDGAPDGAFVRCTQASPCSAAQMMNVVAVKLYVLVRGERFTAGHTDLKTYRLGSADANCASAANADALSTCAPVLGPFRDGFRRHLFTQTVRLVNVSGRRETP